MAHIIYTSTKDPSSIPGDVDKYASSIDFQIRLFIAMEWNQQLHPCRKLKNWGAKITKQKYDPRKQIQQKKHLYRKLIREKNDTKYYSENKWCHFQAYTYLNVLLLRVLIWELSEITNIVQLDTLNAISAERRTTQWHYIFRFYCSFSTNQKFWCSNQSLMLQIFTRKFADPQKKAWMKFGSEACPKIRRRTEMFFFFK